MSRFDKATPGTIFIGALDERGNPWPHIRRAMIAIGPPPLRNEDRKRMAALENPNG